MEKKNTLFDNSIDEKIEKQRGKKNEEGEKRNISWKTVLMGVITVLFAVSILMRILL